MLSIRLVDVNFAVQDMPQIKGADGKGSKIVVFVDPATNVQVEVLMNQTAWDKLVAQGNGKPNIITAPAAMGDALKSQQR